MQPDKRKALEASAVRASFWIGGIALVALKGVAYMLSSSGLVRASMFESLGDVLSSAIMAITQWKVADERDRHLYPVGKRRLTPLGILFFSAYMVATMSSMAIESIQALASGPEQADASATLAMHRLFDEKPSLRGGLGKEQLDQLIAQYATTDAEGSSSSYLAQSLVAMCIAAKGVLLIWCSYVGAKTGSEISKTLAQDHRNDVASNLLVVLVMFLVDGLRRHGCNSSWLDKIDPGASLLLASWITYGWVVNALEQVTLLSNRRADSQLVDAVTSAAREHLAEGPLQLTSADLYHIGEGLEARLEVCLRPGRNIQADRVAAALDALEAKIREVDGEVKEVQARLRSAEQGGVDHSWTTQYSSLSAASVAAAS